MTTLGSVLVFLLSAALLTCIILLVIACRKPAAPSGKPPAWKPRELLEEDQRALYADLSGVCDKLGLHLFARVSLGELLDMSSPKNTSWEARLQPMTVDFVVADAQSDRPALVLFYDQQGSGSAARAEMVAALEAAGVQQMTLRSYNLPGLEKAIREKVRPAGRAAKETAGREKYEAEQVDHAEVEA